MTYTNLCSICLVSELRGTFGVLAVGGSGEGYWPPTLKADESDDVSSHFSLISTRAFPISDSNWSIEDAVATQKPLYYDCSSDIAGEEEYSATWQ